MKTFSKIAYAALALGLMSGATAQAGETAHQGKQVVVSYADLDISHEAGARVLIGRLEQAASKVCGEEPDMRDLEMHSIYNACMKDTMGRAVATVNSPLVASLSGRSLPHEAGRPLTHVVALSH